MAHNIPGIANFRDRVWTIQHPSRISISFTDYNQEITGHEDGAEDFPVLGRANRLGWKVTDGGTNT